VGTALVVSNVLSSDAEAREAWAEELLDRLTPVMSALGILFLLVVLAEQMAREGTVIGTVLTVVGWVLWVVFVAEFVARLVVAPDTGRFLRRNWWQVVFLALPMLRVLRLVRALRFLRAGRMLSSAVRSSRSAHRILTGRVGWLAVVSAITVLVASQLLYEFGAYDRYADALHAAALGAIGGEPLGQDSGFAMVMDVVLVGFSVVVFATLAGSLGAYFLDRRDSERS
jgi:voltage-gated potassium channel